MVGTAACSRGRGGGNGGNGLLDLEVGNGVSEEWFVHGFM